LIELTNWNWSLESRLLIGKINFSLTITPHMLLRRSKHLINSIKVYWLTRWNPIKLNKNYNCLLVHWIFIKCLPLLFLLSSFDFKLSFNVNILNLLFKFFFSKKQFFHQHFLLLNFHINLRNFVLKSFNFLILYSTLVLVLNSFKNIQSGFSNSLR